MHFLTCAKEVTLGPFITFLIARKTCGDKLCPQICTVLLMSQLLENRKPMQPNSSKTGRFLTFRSLVMFIYLGLDFSKPESFLLRPHDGPDISHCAGTLF